MLLPEPDSHWVGTWLFKDFCYIFHPNISEDQKQQQKKPYHLGLQALCHGKFIPGYCITLIKRLDEGLRLQLLKQGRLISPRVYI